MSMASARHYGEMAAQAYDMTGSNTWNELYLTTNDTCAARDIEHIYINCQGTLKTWSRFAKPNASAAAPVRKPHLALELLNITKPVLDEHAKRSRHSAL
jgi:hypothetical protein